MILTACTALHCTKSMLYKKFIASLQRLHGKYPIRSRFIYDGRSQKEIFKLKTIFISM